MNSDVGRAAPAQVAHVVAQVDGARQREAVERQIDALELPQVLALGIAIVAAVHGGNQTGARRQAARHVGARRRRALVLAAVAAERRNQMLRRAAE
jgi:hypothetical protein